MADGSNSVENEIFRRKRETCWISVPRCVRADEIQCTVESSADIAHIGRQGTDAEGEGRMWLGTQRSSLVIASVFLGKQEAQSSAEREKQGEVHS